MKYPKLPKAFKRKWVAALRSGKFKQGKEALKKLEDDKTFTYCCLGVACEVVGAKVNLSEIPGFIDNYNFVRGINKIPKILHGCSGLPEKLASMNDRTNPKKYTFKGIASWIEKHL